MFFDTRLSRRPGMPPAWQAGGPHPFLTRNLPRQGKPRAISIRICIVRGEFLSCRSEQRELTIERVASEFSLVDGRSTPSEEFQIMNPSSRLSRRTFLKLSAASAGVIGFPQILPSRAWAQSPNSKLNVAIIGCGNRSHQILPAVVEEGDNIIAMCDVDPAGMAALKAGKPSPRDRREKKGGKPAAALSAAVTSVTTDLSVTRVRLAETQTDLSAAKYTVSCKI